MNHLPRPPKDGERITALHIRQLISAVRSIIPQSSDTVDVIRSSSGVMLRSKRTSGLRGDAGDPTIQHPFQLLNVSTLDPEMRIQVRYGTMSSQVPEMATVSLSLSPYFIPDDDATTLVWLHLTETGPVSDLYTFDSLIVDWGPALPDNDELNCYVLLGEVDAAAGLVTAIRQAVTHSLEHTHCGTGDASHRVWGL